MVGSTLMAQGAIAARKTATTELTLTGAHASGTSSLPTTVPTNATLNASPSDAGAAGSSSPRSAPPSHPTAASPRGNGGTSPGHSPTPAGVAHVGASTASQAVVGAGLIAKVSGAAKALVALGTVAAAVVVVAHAGIVPELTSGLAILVPGSNGASLFSQLANGLSGHGSGGFSLGLGL